MTTVDTRVFISSTSEDLKVHRAVARNAVMNQHWFPVMMEYMGASGKNTVTACLDLVESCDLFVLIVAFRQGWVPTVEEGGTGEETITALELHHARSKKIPVLAIFADDDWPGKLWEKDQKAREWVEHFRGNLNQPAVFFPPETDASLPLFKNTLSEQLVTFRAELLEKQSKSIQQSDRLTYVPSVIESMFSGDSIPFIGPSIYGDGPLSPMALARELAPDLDESELSLPIAAEHNEQRTGSRAIFLKHLAKIIKNQSKKAAVCRIHKLIASISQPWFLIYTGLDQRLEECLDNQNVPYVIVTHIGRSYRAKYDSKILVLRAGAVPVICAADALEVDRAENIIYRPLGSPLLHEGLNEDWELDTVVVTESDYLAFLGRSYPDSTQVPTRFARWLDSRPLIFLGYTMEKWHFRLVMTVFQSIGGSSRRASTFAVRKSATPSEEIAWTRLKAKQIPIELDEFLDIVDDPINEPSPA